MKYFLGIDQSFSCPGITLINENGELVDSTAIPVSNDFFKFYKDNEMMDFEATIAFKTGLVDSEMKITKKKSTLTKDEEQLLKVSQSKRIHYICLKIEQFIRKNKVEFPNLRSGLENISLGSKGAIVDLARLLGGIEHHLQMLGVRHVLFAPTQVKALAGKGNYSKEEMIAAVPESDMKFLESKCEINAKGAFIGLEDMTDAYWISKLALLHFNKPL